MGMTEKSTSRKAYFRNYMRANSTLRAE